MSDELVILIDARRNNGLSKLIRFISLIFLHFAMTVSLAAVFFIIFPLNGDYLGVVVAQLWLILILLFGDRLILSTVQAKKIQRDSELGQTLENLVVLARYQKSIDLYVTSKVRDQVIVVDSYVNHASIILGKDVYAHLSCGEKSTVLDQSVRRLQFGRWKYAATTTQLLSILCLGLFIVSKFPRLSYLKASLCAPADFLLKMIWKIGGVQTGDTDFSHQMHLYFPKMWFEPKLNPKSFRELMIEWMISNLLLISPQTRTLIGRIKLETPELKGRM